MKEKNKRKTSEKDITEILTNDYKFSRWAALHEAVNLIFDHSKERNQNFVNIDLKPLAIQKFVEIKSDEILEQMEREQKK